jgi:hypothetical protein
MGHGPPIAGVLEVTFELHKNPRKLSQVKVEMQHVPLEKVAIPILRPNFKIGLRIAFPTLADLTTDTRSGATVTYAEATQISGSRNKRCSKKGD